MTHDHPVAVAKQLQASGVTAAAALVFELPNGDWHLAEVVEFAPRHLKILCRGVGSALPVGTILTGIRVFLEGACILHCAAHVDSVLPTALPHTSAVALELLVQAAAAHEQLDQRQDQAEIDAVVADIIKMHASATLTIDGVGLAQHASVDLANNGHKELVLAYQGRLEGWKPMVPCEINCDALGRRVNLYAYVRLSNANQGGKQALFVTWPHRMAEAKRRKAVRVQHLTVPVTLRTHMPFTGLAAGKETTYSVIDLSASGIAFEVNPEQCTLVGMVLPHVVVELTGGHVEARGTVRNIRHQAGKLVVGMALDKMSPASERLLVQFVEQYASRKLRLAKAADLPLLWALYDASSHLSSLSIHTSSSAARSRMAQQRHAAQTQHSVLLERGQALLTQLLLGIGDDIQGTAALWQVGQNVWRLTLPLMRDHTTFEPQALLEPLLQTAVRRPEIKYLQVFWPQGPSAPLAAQLQAFAPAAQFAARAWQAYCGEPEILSNDMVEETRHARDDDVNWIVRRCQRWLTPLELQALDFNDKDLQGAGLKQAYRHVGLEYQRQIRLACGVADTLGFSLSDIGLPVPSRLAYDGYALTRLFPASQVASERRMALCTLMRDAHTAQQSLAAEPLFWLPQADAHLLQEQNLQDLGTWWEFILEREKFVDLPQLLHKLT